MKRSHAFLVLGLFLTMLLLGWAENIRGPAIPLLRQDLSISYQGIGVMLSSYSLVYFVTVFVAGLLAARVGRSTLLLVGYGIAAVALPAALLVQNYFSLLIMMGVLALGLGIFEIVLNAAGADAFPHRTAFMMNVLHLFYGLGAVAGPIYAGLLFQHGLGWRPVYAFMALGFLVVVPVIVLGRATAGSSIASEPPAKDAQQPSSPGGSPGGVAALKPEAGRVLILGLLLGGAMTFELAVAAWLVNFLVEVREQSASVGAGYLASYFAFFSLGRLVGAVPAERVGYLRMIQWFLALALLSFIGLIVFPRAMFLAGATGFFVSILFPTVMAVIIHEFRSLSGAVMGVVIPMAGFINMVSGPVLGAAHDRLGVTLGFSLIGVFALLGIVSAWVLRRLNTAR